MNDVCKAMVGDWISVKDFSKLPSIEEIHKSPNKMIWVLVTDGQRVGDGYITTSETIDDIGSLIIEHVVICPYCNMWGDDITHWKPMPSSVMHGRTEWHDEWPIMEGVDG